MNPQYVWGLLPFCCLFEDDKFIFVHSDESSIFTETFTSEMLPLAKRITTDTNVDPIKLVEQLKECLQKRKMV